MLGFLYPLLPRLTPQWVTSTEILGRAMIARLKPRATPATYNLNHEKRQGRPGAHQP